MLGREENHDGPPAEFVKTGRSHSRVFSLQLYERVSELPVAAIMRVAVTGLAY
jgi:hypothetical protein